MPIIAGILIIFLLQLVSSFIITNSEKRGILITLLILMFFTYGIVYETIQNLTGIELLLVYGLIFILSTFFLIRTKRNVYTLNKVLNIIAISFILINIVQLITFEIDNDENLFAFDNEQPLLNLDNKPDIYYIILDGYANSTILKEFYKYNNKEFEDFLIKKGFYVSTKSRSNYPETLLSLNSSLNMDYFNVTNKPLERVLYISIQNTKVMQLLNKAGYKIINLSSSGYIANMEAADLNVNYASFLTSEFYALLFRYTMLRIVKGHIPSIDLYRERIFKTFSKLGDIKREMAKSDDPTFVFAHILLPHPPYVFGTDGELPKGSYRIDLKYWGHSVKSMELYKNQLVFLNKMMMKVIDNIVSNARDNSIIILQSDHGPYHIIDNNRNNVRMKNFTAFLLPKGDENIFYNSITPVNIFRLIFNHYFKTHYDLLEDKNYYPENKPPHKFLDVTKDINNITVSK
jgi:hypothetical protein